MFEQRVNSDVLTVSTVNSQDQVTQKPLRDSVKQALKNYFAQLNGQDVNDLYELVLAEVEQPLLDMVMQYTRGNQTRAALMMGINRGTLPPPDTDYPQCGSHRSGGENHCLP